MSTYFIPVVNFPIMKWSDSRGFSAYESGLGLLVALPGGRSQCSRGVVLSPIAVVRLLTFCDFPERCGLNKITNRSWLTAKKRESL